jgi:hypothetical protein
VFALTWLRTAAQTSEENRPVVQAGDIYQRYQTSPKNETWNRCQTGESVTSSEHLNLIEAEYHYGGNKGKTREVRLGGVKTE